MAAPLSASPPFFLDAPPRAVLQLNGSGPNTDRQQSSHPHDVVTVPGRTEILVPDLGADRTWRLTYDEAGSALSVQGSVEYPAGSGPRHAVFQGQSTFSATWRPRTRDAYVYDTENILYTVNELTNTLTTHSLPPLPASATLLNTTSTLQLQPGEALGDRAPAELLLAPALNANMRRGRRKGSVSRRDGGNTSFLYATNRNDPSPEGDTLAIFSLEDPAAPALIQEVHTGLQHLRGAAIGGDDGRYIIMGGMLGGGVKMFERVDGGRSVMEIAALPDIQGPTGFQWLRQENCTATS
jgi:Lactonase, 7-bladed beta-propeller